MQVLPPVTEPPSVPFPRRHVPPQRRGKCGYQRYRSCARWEFGFTCAFCLLHENDISVGLGVERRGLTALDHRQPRSRAPHLTNVYGNCYYVCRWCNIRRGGKPVRSGRARLLDPCKDRWSDHFEVRDLKLVPKSGDLKAQYTTQLYSLNDDTRVELRRERRILYEEHLPVLLALLDEEVELVRLHRTLGKQRFLVEAKVSRESVRKLLEPLRRRLLPVPSDAPSRAGCDVDGHDQLPSGLATQLRAVDFGA